MSTLLEATAVDAFAPRDVLSMFATLAHWAAAPDDPTRILVPSGREDALGVAEAEVSAAQRRVQEVVERQRGLAELGLSVAKISHDLKSLLSVARLRSDRLADVSDPSLQEAARRLQATLDKAVAYADAVLAHGRTRAIDLDRGPALLARIVDEAAELAGLKGHAEIQWHNDVPRDLEVDVDGEQLVRVFLNLMRNAVQALEGPEAIHAPGVTVTARRIGRTVRVRFADNGPGLPPKARMNLFRPFLGAARMGGAGLGLPIAADILRAHGGAIRMLGNEFGATFMLEIPDRLGAAGAVPVGADRTRPRAHPTGPYRVHTRLPNDG